MKASALTFVLSVSGIALLAANFYVSSLTKPNPAFRPAEASRSIQVHSKGRAEPAQSARPTTNSPVSTGADPDLTAANPALAAVVQGSAFDWAAVESSNYKQYAANLRAIGFPEQLVRAIVILDVNALYAPREAPLRFQSAAPDAPLSERQRLPTEADLERLNQLRALGIEKQAVLKEILGTYVPREILRTPTARNYDAYEYALDQLPLEKRDAAQTALEDEWIADDSIKGLRRPEYVEKYRQNREARNIALNQVLTPIEYDLFEMNSTPAATELARRIIGMEPTDAEFAAMFRVAWKNWEDSGGVYGLWHAVPVPRERIAAADREMEASLQSVLGPDRYLDYQMATTESGQQLRNFASRYGLPRETLALAFQLQAEADALMKPNGIVPEGIIQQPTGAAVPTEIQPRLAALQQQMQRTLGETLWQSWIDGRSRRVSLEP